MYIETSHPRRQGEKARFVSPSRTPVKGGQCFQFWYHMYGNDIGRLNIYIKIGANFGIPVWTRAGNRGNVWKVAQVPITTTSNFNVCALVFLLLARIIITLCVFQKHKSQYAYDHQGLKNLKCHIAHHASISRQFPTCQVERTKSKKRKALISHCCFLHL